MTEKYEPDSRFVERLEWQLSSEFRRSDRLKSPPKITVSRRVAAATFMIGVLLTGVAVMKAADYFKDSWRKKIEIARAETEVTLKKARYDSTREIAASVEEQVASGLVREEEYFALRRAATKAELDWTRSELDLDEVRVSGDAPRDELYAPKVGGCDFVSERLIVDKESAMLDLEQVENVAKRYEKMVEQGLVSANELDRIRTELASRRMAVEKIQERLEIRKRFVAGEITAMDVEIRARMTFAEKQLQEARAKVDAMTREMRRLEALEAKGMVSPKETDRLQYGLDAALAELKLAELEIDILRKVK